MVPNIVSPTCKQGCCRGVQQQERATICANNHCPSFTPLRHCLQFIGNLTFHSNSGRPDCRTPKAPPLPRHILGDGRLLFALPPRHCNSTNLSQISLMKESSSTGGIHISLAEVPNMAAARVGFRLRLANWNIAAINRNPWVSSSKPCYGNCTRTQKTHTNTFVLFFLIK